MINEGPFAGREGAESAEGNKADDDGDEVGAEEVCDENVRGGFGCLFLGNIYSTGGKT